MRRDTGPQSKLRKQIALEKYKELVDEIGRVARIAGILPIPLIEDILTAYKGNDEDHE